MVEALFTRHIRPDGYVDVKKLAQQVAEEERDCSAMQGIPPEIRDRAFIGSSRCIEAIVLDANGHPVPKFLSHDYGTSLATPPVGLTSKDETELVLAVSRAMAIKCVLEDRDFSIHG